MRIYEKRVLIIVSVILILLFLLSSTDLIIKEDRQKEVHKISVIVNDSGDEYWINYKMGMEKAADKWNAEVNFITIDDKGDILQQMEYIEGTGLDGAEALIISPTDAKVLKRYLDEYPVNIPIITIGSDVESEAVNCNIGADYYAMGQELGASILEAYGKQDMEVTAFSYTENRTDTQEIFTGLQEYLTGSNIYPQKVYCATKTFMNSFINRRYEKDKPNIIICLDPYTMEFAIDIDFENNSKAVKLYGVGYTNKILNYLDAGSIQGVLVNSNYDMGYLSVEKVVQVLQKSFKAEDVELEYKFIRPEDVYKEEYELLLFPKS